MQTSAVASVAAHADYRGWLKSAAKATFLLLFIKGTVWLGAAWLALRGFQGM